MGIGRSKHNHSSSHSSVGEWLFAMFVFAGYYKADPRLEVIQSHIDITLLFLVLSFLVFLYRDIRSLSLLRLPHNSVNTSLLFLLLAACLFGGLLQTQSHQYGLDKAIRFVFITGWAFFGTLLFMTDILSIKRFSWAIVVISTAMTIDALLGYPGGAQFRFITAFGSNYIALARTGGIGLLTSVIFLLPAEQRRLMRLSLWVIAALQLWATLSAGAKGPVLAFILSLLFFFVMSVRVFPRFKVDRFALRLGVVTLITTVLIGLVGHKLFYTLEFRTKLLATELGDSALMRISLYRSAVNLWASSPILGGGTGQLSVAAAGEDIRLYPHNIILELGAETGFIGVLIFVILIGLALRKGLILLRSKERIVRIIGRYLFVAFCFVLLNAMVSGDINDNRLLFTFTGLLMTSSCYRRNAEHHRKSAF